MFQHKIKSVSPLIATILLIVIAVILVVAVLTWGKDFVGESLEETKIFYQESNLTGFVTSQGNINNFITIANNHSKKSISVIGYRIITSTNHKYFHLLNNDYYLEEKITINPRQSSTIRVHCLPESSFSLDLLLEDNSFVRVNVNVRDYKDKLCSIYNDNLIKNGELWFDTSGDGLADEWFFRVSGNINVSINNGIKKISDNINNTGWTNKQIMQNIGAVQGQKYHLVVKARTSNSDYNLLYFRIGDFLSAGHFVVFSLTTEFQEYSFEGPVSMPNGYIYISVLQWNNVQSNEYIEIDYLRVYEVE